jgi:hypothetical protein
MNYEEKIKKWLEYAKSNSIPNSIARPLIDRVLSSIGFRLPPFFFWKFPWVALALGCQFGVFWGLFMYLTVWRERSVLSIVIATLSAAIPFGIFMAAFFSFLRRKWPKPSWKSISEE